MPHRASSRWCGSIILYLGVKQFPHRNMVRQMNKQEQTELCFSTELSYASWHILNQPSSLLFLVRQTFFDGGKQTVSSAIYTFCFVRDDMIHQCHIFDCAGQCVIYLAHQSIQAVTVISYDVFASAETHWGTRCSPKKSRGSEEKTRRIKSQEQSAVQRSENPEGTDCNPAGERKTR